MRATTHTTLFDEFSLVLRLHAANRCLFGKVIICTDGKANTDLGNLELEDEDSHTILSSTIFYQDLGEYAANQGWVHPLHTHFY